MAPPSMSQDTITVVKIFPVDACGSQLGVETVCLLGWPAFFAALCRYMLNCFCMVRVGGVRVPLGGSPSQVRRAVFDVLVKCYHHSKSHHRTFTNARSNILTPTVRPPTDYDRLPNATAKNIIMDARRITGAVSGSV